MNEVPYRFPYSARSITGDELEFQNEDDVWDEIFRIAERSKRFSIGQNLYNRLPTFCRSGLLLDPWSEEMINEFIIMQRMNVPIARSLGEADAMLSDAFLIIESELNACEVFKMKQLKQGK